MSDQPYHDSCRPDWPLPDLLRAAEAHWDDAGRLRLLARDMEHRTEPGARELLDRVNDRLRDLPSKAAPRGRVIRRSPVLSRTQPPPLPDLPTPEMAAVLRQLASERASGDRARREAAVLRKELAEQRARLAKAETAALYRREVEAARAEARQAREEAARLADRLAFVTAASAHARRDPEPARPGRDPAPPHRKSPEPAYAELGLSPDLPDELLPVLERALLRHHHPDRAPPEMREVATRRFQDVTRAFEQIRRLRGLSG